jgi:8-oxo-dGTP pyrophosphatase MutT (NUDIX family)
LERHLTATGFVVDGDRVLLHWHRKNQLWLPFGGHIELNEDPVQTVLREIEEECGLRAALLCPPDTFGVTNLPVVAPPVLILLEPTTDGVHEHEHVDLIYFCRPVGGIDSLATDVDPTIHWVSASELELNQPVMPLPGVAPATIPDDVRRLALAAIAQGAEIRPAHPQYP